MWSDRFLFVFFALIAIAIVTILKHCKETSHRILIIGLLLVPAIIVFDLRMWLYSNDPTSPNTGNLIAIFLGAVVGIFTGRFVASLFGAEFSQRDPLIGAAVLALLFVVYSLPLYSSAVNDFMGKFGVSNIKTPFLELSLQERGTKNYTAAAGGQVTLGEVPRRSNPAPGLRWLAHDTKVVFDDKAPTFPMDQAYIRFFEQETDKNDKYKNIVKDTEIFLKQAQIMSKCLNDYIENIPDAALLAVDIAPVLKELFRAHKKMKDISGSKEKIRDADKKETKKVGQNAIQLYFSKAISNVIDNVNGTIPNTCDKDEIANEEPLLISHDQPYSALVLADLVYARGAPDEAIEILAEWLTHHSPSRYQEGEKGVAWWRLRVMSRITLWVAEIAGQNSIAYQTFINSYKNDLESYFENKNISLSSLKYRCKVWQSLNERQGFGDKNGRCGPGDLEVEQRAFYLLLAAEDESLRTELNFIGEIKDLSRLEHLQNRAEILGRFGPECLPAKFKEKEDVIADHHVTIGVIGLTLADRMRSIAQSRGDHERADNIAHQAVEQYLRRAHARLSDRVMKKRGEIKSADVEKGRCKGCENWTTRIFEQSAWEKSVNLAGRAMIRLREKD